MTLDPKNQIPLPFFILFVICMFFKPVLCFLFLGIVCLYYSIHILLTLNKLNKNKIESFGKIVSYETDSEGFKIPIIEFETSDRKTYKGKPFIHASSDLDRFRTYAENINKNIKIQYNFKEPENFIIKDNSNGCSVILVTIVGLILLGISIGNLLGYNDIF
ncbi:hypothetical protein HNP37_003134 [Flavobacterium nitrogenifigens]|uniref:DUF3592 domain-containing protein n=2 Tax=Flavobacterium TaxID=237 RepID=A0A7W7N937_9FLAO|nr:MULTISPECIES: hypothetical protein [Flavobacterium]MBB4803059.1 hypothetical protein [Flavobacterium nitrogenifigens]MBB6388017.1 hypothetical protein [Flavobacterium notoginsengisoli]